MQVVRAQHTEVQIPVLQISYDTLCTDSFTMGTMDLIIDDTTHYYIEIRRRGASSLKYSKPSLAIKLIDSIGNKLDTTLLGMREDNYWILDAMVSDKARARNRASMDLWLEIARDPWYKDLEPKCINGYRGQMVMVEINHQPMGIYHFCERMDRKQLKLKKYNPDKGGIRGLLYKSEDWTATNPFTYTTTPPADTVDFWSGYTVSYPELDEGDSITWQPLVDFTKFARTHSYVTIQPEINDYIDMPVYIDYTLLISLLSARDNNGKNIYWSYYDQTVSKKALVSLWDMDHSWGRQYNGNEELTSLESTNRLYTKLIRTAPFRDSLYHRYAELRQHVFTVQHLDSVIGKYLDLYEKTGMDQVEEKLWNGVDGIQFDISEERAYIHRWLVERIAFLDRIYQYTASTYPVEGIKTTPECFTEEEKNRCQRLNSDNTITLIFRPDRYGVTEDSVIHSVYAYGTFTAWTAPLEEYKLPYYSSDSCFYTTLPFHMLERPGNSGSPELYFRLYYRDEIETDTTFVEPYPMDSGMYMVDQRLNIGDGGMLLMWPGDDINEMAKRVEKINDIAGLAEWQLTDEQQQARFANFRLVPGTNYLYRSFHPFYPIIKDETAEQRVHYSTVCAERVGIKTAICLSGNQEKKEGVTLPCGENSMVVHIPDYYKSMIDQQNVLYVGQASGSGLSYNNTLWFINHHQYQTWMAEVVHFVCDARHSAPYQIHCSLGADRTGSFCAVIAALCGATWEEIALDYEATSNTRCLFRNRGLIRYTLRQMLGEDPEYISDLQAAMTDYMVSENVLTREEIQDFVSRLQKPTTPTDLGDQNKDVIKIMLHSSGKIVIIKNGISYGLLGERL